MAAKQKRKRGHFGLTNSDFVWYNALRVRCRAKRKIQSKCVQNMDK